LVQSSRRWGPWGKGKKVIFSPEVTCQATHKCLERKCEDYYCMNKIRPDALYKKMKYIFALKS
jgi:hypothetical protein